MAAPLMAKIALQAAQSKTGRRLLMACAAVTVLLPVVVLGVPLAVAVAAVSMFGGGPGFGGGGDDGDTGGGGAGCQSVTQCQVTNDARDLARQIMVFTSVGKVTWLDTRFEQQVATYARGATVDPNCTIDTRVLQVIVLAVQREGSAGISSINRRCTGQTPGAGRASFHWKGKAVDFYSLGGTVIRTARESQPLDLIQFLGPLVPKGSRSDKCSAGPPFRWGTSTPSTTAATTNTCRSPTTTRRCTFPTERDAQALIARSGDDLPGRAVHVPAGRCEDRLIRTSSLIGASCVCLSSSPRPPPSSSSLAVRPGSTPTATTRIAPQLRSRSQPQPRRRRRIQSAADRC